MISTHNHFLNHPVYASEWPARAVEIEAWVLYRQMLLETSLRRQFPRLYAPDGNMQPVVDELARAGILESNQPWQHGPASLPRTAYMFEQIVKTDLRWAHMPVVDGASVVAVCNTICGTWHRPGYRVHPKTFAQLREWNRANDDEDAHYVGMMWAEEDWLSDVLVDVEILYYNYVRGTAAKETL